MQKSRTVITANKVMTTTGVEVSQVIQANSTLADYTIKRIQIKSREYKDMQYAYQTGGPYITIPAGQTYYQDDIDAAKMEVFLVGTIDGQIAELEWWI